MSITTHFYRKAKSSKSKDTDDGKGDGEGDPGTLVADGTTDLGKEPTGGKKKKGKGKKKRTRLSKSEKNLEKLDKAVTKLKGNRDFYHQFLHTIDKWLIKNAKQVINMFKQLDIEEEGSVTYDEFKSGMFDVGLPCNKTELHLLVTLLDRESSGEIEYEELHKGLQYYKELEEMDKEAEDEARVLVTTRKKSEPCKVCNKMGIDGPYINDNPRYILLKLRLVTFDTVFKRHPSHIEILVQSDITVYGILQLITEKTALLSTKLAVFSDDSRNRESMLSPEMTLKELGYEGDSMEDPEELLLYYDYKVEFNDCPILMCDHFIGQDLDK
ncbi:hypothetical protein FSP39_014418 [Pinctada imbricata]|uniref:EF-hand domain-containing protein n=1 Tax=Pinctada imbricata TaxID=66713 RepID=A0AA88XIW0_PINIB|nr:hypothetical protein FSP39_014418 [Pinctada imbricata]